MLAEYVALAVDTIRAQRLRAALTVLAIALGVGAVIVLTSVAQSGLATITKGLEEMGGARIILIWQDDPKAAAKKKGNYLKGLTRADAAAIRERVGAIERLTAFNQGPKGTYHRRGVAEQPTDVVPGDETFMATWPLNRTAARPPRKGPATS
jgi:putative ABC transport system permease protein